MIRLKQLYLGNVDNFYKKIGLNVSELTEHTSITVKTKNISYNWPYRSGDLLIFYAFLYTPISMQITNDTLYKVRTDLLRRTRENKDHSLLIVIFSYCLSVHQAFVLKCRHSTWTGRSQDCSARFQVFPDRCNGSFSRKCPLHWLDDQVNPKIYCFSRFS